MSPDPSQLYYADPTNPQSLNLYSYAQNNPLVNVDPNGLDCIYTSNLTSTSVSVETVRGDCRSETDNGVYVDGTVNTDSYKARVGSDGDVHLGFGYTPDDSDSGSTGNGSTTLKLYSGSTDIGKAINPDTEISPWAQEFIKQAYLSQPAVCSGGAFIYAGVQKNMFGGHGFGGYLGNWDSKTGWSNNGLLEGSGNAGAAGAYSKKSGFEGLVFMPAAESMPFGYVGSMSKEGTSLGMYAGTPEKFPVGLGGGGYYTISSVRDCVQ